MTKDGEILLQNTKSPTDSLWTLDLANWGQSSIPPFALQTIRLDSEAEFVKFTHAVFGSCPVSTFTSAVDLGWLGNYPKISGRMIRRNPPISRATAMGYLDQTRQGQRSTRQANATPTPDEFLRVTVLTAKELMNSSDATGRFPIITKSGWEYLLVSTMGGYVHLQLLKSRSKSEYVRVYKLMYDYFQQYGHQPTIQRLDNESSSDLEVFLRACDVKIQYVPPGIHRQTPSECAIRHTKNCIIAMCTMAERK